MRQPGPVKPTVDLRDMLRSHIVRRCLEALERGNAARRQATDEGRWDERRGYVRERIASYLGPMPVGAGAPPVNARTVSRHERPEYIVENVLFDSVPGWEVNGSVYLPADAPPPWPGVVVPVGHSGKQFENYQHPAQVFARCGYAAITFDPPGQAGEKQPGNDHFRDGVRCYLTGECSNRYFIADALRCIDYLAGREDVDTSGGVAMTGVSGGGHTTMFATLLDERIAVAGPVCCAVPMADHPVLDCYACCPELLPIGRIADGIEETDLLCAAMPTPVLLAAGKLDEVFHIAWSRRMAAEIGDAYGSAGAPDHFVFHEAEGGHGYSVDTALTFVAWMNRWLLGEPGRAVPKVTAEDLEVLPWDMLRCHPSAEENMVTLTRRKARELKATRSPCPEPRQVRQAVSSMTRVEGTVPIPECVEGEPHRVWLMDCRELLLRPEEGIELPATFLSPVDSTGPGPALLHLDERGRWADLQRHGLLACASGFIDRERGAGPAVLSVDLRGWGDSAPCPIPYDMAGWSGLDRWHSYVSSALGDHVTAMRMRDAAAALAYLRERPEVDPARVVLTGRGLGAVVALCAAALGDPPAGVVCLEMPASFEAILAGESCAWPQDVFVAGALVHLDLPEVAAGLGVPVHVVRPLDAERRPLAQEAAEAVYGAALGGSADLRVQALADAAEAGRAFLAAVDALLMGAWVRCPVRR